MDVIEQFASDVFVAGWAIILLAIIVGKLFKRSKLSPYIAITGIILLIYSCVFYCSKFVPILKVLSTVAVIASIIYSFVWIHNHDK